MRTRTLFLYVCLSLLTATTAYADNGDTAAPPATLAGDLDPNPALRTSLAVSGGCVGGAVIGTVVPIFGNFVGCALGGLAGWWFGRDKSTVVADQRIATPR